MTEWQSLQWFIAAFGAVTGAASCGWVLMQGRKLHREERERYATENKLFEIVDLIASKDPATWWTVPRDWRKPVMLGREWGALVVMWNKGEIQTRLSSFGDYEKDPEGNAP